MGPVDRTAPPRVLAGLVVLVLAAMAVGGFVSPRHSARNEQEHLLGERTTEVAAILSTAVSLQTSLHLTGQVYGSGPDDAAAFSAAATTLVSGGVTTVGVAEVVGDAVVVRAREGTGAAVGDALVDARAEVVRRAIGAGGLVSTLIPGSPLSTLVVALAEPGGTVVYEESQFP